MVFLPLFAVAYEVAYKLLTKIEFHLYIGCQRVKDAIRCKQHCDKICLLELKTGSIYGSDTLTCDPASPGQIVDPVTSDPEIQFRQTCRCLFHILLLWLFLFFCIYIHRDITKYSSRVFHVRVH